jgi:hypothetical protein
MSQLEEEFSASLHSELRILHQQVHYWQDPRVIEMQNLSGSKKTAKEIVAELKLRIGEVGHLIASLSK